MMIRDDDKDEWKDKNDDDKNGEYKDEMEDGNED